MKFSTLATIASTLLISTSALAQGGPPGGPAPETPASFSAAKIGSAYPLSDRLLALTVPGQSTMPAKFSGSVPVGTGTITINASTWDIGYEVYHPSPNSSQILAVSTQSVFSGTGKTGAWNGTDPGWTILPNGAQGGGYGQFAMQIVLNTVVNQYYIWQTPVMYKYKGTHTFYYGVAGDPSQVKSKNYEWAASLMRGPGG
jgi:hypothetical protein